MEFDALPQAGRYLFEALFEAEPGGSADDTVVNQAVRPAIACDYTESGAFGAAIDAKHAHGR
jgi:hypothetical protein